MARSNGEGTITQRENGKWRAQYYIGDVRKSVTKDTKEEIINFLAIEKAKYLQGYHIEEKMTVKAWLEFYMKTYMGDITEGTRISYQRFIDKYLIPTFGSYNLDELNIPMLEVGYATMFQSKSYKAKEKKYSHATLNAVAVFFKKSLRKAVILGMLNKNPHEGIQLHKLRPPKKVEAYSKEQQEELIKILQEKMNSGERYDHLYNIFYFLFGTGMRIGETQALTWEDIDFEKNTININKTVVEIHGNASIKHGTKTDSGIRKIQVPDKIMEMLSEEKKRQDSELNMRSLVFVSTTYNFRTQANLRRLWQRLCDEIGVEYKAMHALRHSWATRALEAGIDVKKVSVMMGHKNVVTTMNIYQHVLKQTQDGVAEQMNDFI